VNTRLQTFDDFFDVVFDCPQAKCLCEDRSHSPAFRTTDPIRVRLVGEQFWRKRLTPRERKEEGSAKCKVVLDKDRPIRIVIL
jgi:hypothetical protein